MTHLNISKYLCISIDRIINPIRIARVVSQSNFIMIVTTIGYKPCFDFWSHGGRVACDLKYSPYQLLKNAVRYGTNNGINNFGKIKVWIKIVCLLTPFYKGWDFCTKVEIYFF